MLKACWFDLPFNATLLEVHVRNKFGKIVVLRDALCLNQSYRNIEYTPVSIIMMTDLCHFGFSLFGGDIAQTKRLTSECQLCLFAFVISPRNKEKTK